MHFLYISIFLSLLLATSTSISAKPLGFNKEIDSRSMIPQMFGRDIDLVSWQSIPLERTPSDPDVIALQNRNNLEERSVYNPPITHPTSETIWTAGKMVTVKWKVNQEDIPPTADNYKARIVLGYLPYGSDMDEHLYWPLADNFPITDESIKIRLPSDLATRNDYIVVLFGDSGNRSQRFTIKAKDLSNQSIDNVSSPSHKKVHAEKSVAVKQNDTQSDTSNEQMSVKGILSKVIRSPLWTRPSRPCRSCIGAGSKAIKSFTETLHHL